MYISKRWRAKSTFIKVDSTISQSMKGWLCFDKVAVCVCFFVFFYISKAILRIPKPL